MDLVLIVRDALGNSLVGNLVTAIKAKQGGCDAAVLITQEALAALAGGSVGWPRELSGPAMRMTIADGATAMGLPVTGRGEGRQLDVRGVFEKAKEAGVTMYACPIWTGFLNLGGKLPDGLQELDEPGLWALLRNATQVVGSL